MAAIDPAAFDAFEAQGWAKRAEEYDRFFGPITGRVIDPLLDAAAVGHGAARVLDLATGPGYVAARAASRGAAIVGIDVAEPMLELARRRLPGAEFRHADAQALPFADSSFDAVVGNFLILHVGAPERVAAEAHRVLAPGGRLALTTWDVPERARFLGVVLEAVASVGAVPPAEVPAGPPLFRFAADDEFRALLQAFADVSVQAIAFVERFPSADHLWDGILRATVRVSPVIYGQPDEVRAHIRCAFDELLAEYCVADGFDVPVSVKLASGRKEG
jgi:SAM-dependent methyltransferase